MPYYIMSYNSIRGLVSGSFSEPDHLFYKGPNSPESGRVWVPTITDAWSWKTEEEAEAHAFAVWGRSHVRTDFMIVKFDHPYPMILEEGDIVARDLLMRRRFLGGDIISGTVSRQQLLEKSKVVPSDVGLTAREQQIIRIMGGE